MAKLHTLTDSFGGASISSAWTTEQTSLMTIDDGRLRMNADPIYPILLSAAEYDATDSSLVVQVTPPPIGSGSAQAEVGFLRGGGSSQVGILFGGGQITLRAWSGGTISSSVTIGTYTSGSTRWVRIRHVTGGTFAGEVSTDGLAWTGAANVTVPWDPTLVRAMLIAGRYAPEDQEWTWFDNVNLPPAGSYGGTFGVQVAAFASFSGTPGVAGSFAVTIPAPTTDFAPGFRGTFARTVSVSASFSGYRGAQAPVMFWNGSQWLPAETYFWDGLTWVPTKALTL